MSQSSQFSPSSSPPSASSPSSSLSSPSLSSPFSGPSLSPFSFARFSLPSHLSFSSLSSLLCWSLLFVAFSASPASAAGDPTFAPPNEASTLSCPELSDVSHLPHNYTILCFIECNHGWEAVAGSSRAFDYAVDAYDPSTAASGGGGESSAAVPFGLTLTGSISFGSIEFLTGTVTESHIISFRYTTPMEGTEGIIRIQVSTEEGDGLEITGSPILFSLGTRPAPPLVEEEGPSEGFFRTSNPAMWAACGVLAVLLLVGVVVGVWSYRLFRIKRGEVLHRREREEQWSHSVPSLTSRIDGGGAEALRIPFLQ